MNLSQAGKKALEYPILFVCGILTPLFVVLLLMRGPKVSEYEDQLAALERDWQQIQTNVERSAGLDADIDRIEAGIEQVSLRLMQVENVAVNSEFFYDLEREAGISLERFAQGTANDAADLLDKASGLKHFTAIPYDLNLSGSLAQILVFLDLLERQHHIVRIESLRLSPAMASAGQAVNPHLLGGRLRCHVLAEKND